jgi:hypothetical protein
LYTNVNVSSGKKKFVQGVALDPGRDQRGSSKEWKLTGPSDIVI